LASLNSHSAVERAVDLSSRTADYETGAAAATTAATRDICLGVEYNCALSAKAAGTASRISADRCRGRNRLPGAATAATAAASTKRHGASSAATTVGASPGAAAIALAAGRASATIAACF
jgi:hypothetical protein